MTEQEVRHAYKVLMDQIEYMQEQHVRYGHPSAPFRWALQGLFDHAEEMDPRGMKAARDRGKGVKDAI